jgi:DNA-binding response OmpR family regulator
MAKIIAYVEDDRDMIDLVSIILERHGYEVLGFNDSMDILDRLEALKPDLILLDIMMPRVDGFEIYEGLKSKQTTSTIPIVVISAMKKAVDQIERESRIKVEGCLVKPFTISELAELVSKVLSN